MKQLVKLFTAVTWVFGVVIAKGFWSTLFAFCIPFWAWYLSIEWIAVNYVFK